MVTTAGCWDIADTDGDLEERNPNKGGIWGTVEDGITDRAGKGRGFPLLNAKDV